jgi:ribosomal protein L36
MESFYGRISRIDRDCQAVRREGRYLEIREEGDKLEGRF